MLYNRIKIFDKFKMCQTPVYKTSEVKNSYIILYLMFYIVLNININIYNIIDL